MAGRKKKAKARAAAGSRQIAKLVRRQGATAVAKKLGVKPATVNRWQKVGVPKARRVDVRRAVARSDRSAKAAKAWKAIRRDVKVMTIHGKRIQRNPVTQVHYDRETGWILGTSYDKDGKPEVRRAIVRRWWDPNAKRMRVNGWWAFGSRLEGYTPESFFSKYEEFFGEIPVAEIWIDWKAGPLKVRGAARSR